MVEIEGKPYYMNAFQCPICLKWIPNSNVAGNCPYCDSKGFTTLKTIELRKEQEKQDIINKFAESGRKVR